jgi:hypothetical protein
MSFPEFTARVSHFSVISSSVFAPTDSFQPARVPAIRLSHLTESQRMAFLIADNRLPRTPPGMSGRSARNSRSSPNCNSISIWRRSALRFLRSISSSMASTQCPRPILMIACQMSRSLRPPFPVIYGSWASVRQADYTSKWLVLSCL